MSSRIVLFVIFLTYSLQSFSQGLYIRGNKALINERSSYNVFDNITPSFNEVLILDFDFSHVRSRGNVVRIKNQEAGSIYNLSYYERNDISTFKLNHEGKDNLITIAFDANSLKKSLWQQVHIEFDMIKDSVKLRVNETEVTADLEQTKNSWSPQIFFGRSEHVIDVPDFKLCNLKVRDRERTYHFPLNESEGEFVHDSHKKVIGHVENPLWLINDAYYWKQGPVFSSKGVAGSNFNPNTQDIYYFNKDSIIIYNVRSKEVQAHVYRNECLMDMRLGTNFLDLKNDRLYVYEVNHPPGDFTIAYLDLPTLEWTIVSSEMLPEQLHHHSNYMDSENGRYMIFGGFGNSSYFNQFYTFNLHTGRWEYPVFTGDPVTPRYFASMGYNNSDGYVYLFGGMGNKAGDQTIGRVYYYELYRIDPDKGEIEKVWEIPWNKENVSPVRNMVFSPGNDLYVLCYPEHLSHSELKLYRFSVADGKHQILGDPIPIVSEKITTNANLYYNEQSNELISIVQEFDYDDIGSTIKIYSISFPPVTEKELMYYTEPEAKNKLIWVLIIILTGILVVVLPFLKKKEKKQEPVILPQQKHTIEAESIPAAHIPVEKSRPNSICLFGEFSMINKENREINYMLSSKLRQAFFLILYHSLDKGISSQDLSKALWPDKSYEMAKNSRGVTLNNLRKILGDLEGINLLYDKKYYQIKVSGACYCDYLTCLEIVSGNNPEEHMHTFISIISKGKFLVNEDSPILDGFKGYMEAKIESTMYYYMEKAYLSNNYDATISLCESFFNIDPLDEVALQYMIQSLTKIDLKDEAKRRYYLFTTEYKKTTGKDYPKPFDGIVKG